jgi:hypothetical protein
MMQKLRIVERYSHLFQVLSRYFIEEHEENHGIIHTSYLITTLEVTSLEVNLIIPQR